MTPDLITDMANMIASYGVEEETALRIARDLYYSYEFCACD